MSGVASAQDKMTEAQAAALGAELDAYTADMAKLEAERSALDVDTQAAITANDTAKICAQGRLTLDVITREDARIAQARDKMSPAGIDISPLEARIGENDSAAKIITGFMAAKCPA
ncbi:MAG: hypothetical protein QM647_16065 [Asticcacaulis sp.]|uniref:hypothetical protein n=1 Tax=Asticcacaulis sp. TaxID=1872648 RepID=UPI0039E525A5